MGNPVLEFIETRTIRFIIALWTLLRKKDQRKWEILLEEEEPTDILC
jgi:hypothetical protein